jgi:hypothetical protein
MAGFDGIITTNDVYGIWDAWDRSIGYEPNANCDGYILWSNGPDGVRNTKDDLGIAQNE